MVAYWPRRCRSCWSRPLILKRISISTSNLAYPVIKEIQSQVSHQEPSPKACLGRPSTSAMQTHSPRTARSGYLASTETQLTTRSRRWGRPVKVAQDTSRIAQLLRWWTGHMALTKTSIGFSMTMAYRTSSATPSTIWCIKTTRCGLPRVLNAI